MKVVAYGLGVFSLTAYAKQLEASIVKRIDAMTRLHGNSHGSFLHRHATLSIAYMCVCVTESPFILG